MNSSTRLSTPNFIVKASLISLIVSSVFAFQNENLIGSCPPFGPPPFAVEDPRIKTQIKGVILQYPVDVPDPSWVSFQILDFGCQTTIPTDNTLTDSVAEQKDVLTAPLMAELRPIGDSQMNLELDINPYRLSDYSLLYTESGRSGQPPSIQSSGTMQLCVKLSLWNGVPGSSLDVLEVTFNEFPLTFEVEFEVDEGVYLDFIDVSRCGSGCRQLLLSEQSREQPESMESSTLLAPPPAIVALRKLCDSNWGVQTFTCPAEEIGLDARYAIQEEDSADRKAVELEDEKLVRLCVQLNDAADQAGATMKDIKNLYVSQESTDSRQTAVEGGFDAIDGLSTRECGEKVCVVEITLSSNFFADDADGGILYLSVQGTMSYQPSQMTQFAKLDVDFELNFEAKSTTMEGSGVSRHHTDSLVLVTTGIISLLLFVVDAASSFLI